jgi:metallo-beta-lactamase family protein
MQLTPHGAVRNVTGSKHLLSVGGTRALLDCGLFQGRRAESERKNRAFPFDPSSIDLVLLTHAHVDHCGSLPSLVKAGFRGPIYATDVTAELAEVLLKDTARVQAHELDYLNERRRERGSRPLEPIYTEDDVEATLPRFVEVAYDAPTRVAAGVTVTFRDAGHIPGSATLEIDAVERGRGQRIAYTGDLGRRGMPILRDPYQIALADVLITESTYGGRVHGSLERAKEDLALFVSHIARGRGKVVVPAFAVGRTQMVVYELHELMKARRIPEIPIYVDSPLALRATEILRSHPECFDEEMRSLLARDDDPLGFSRLTYVQSIEESKALNDRPGPFIIVSASGMCEGGRVLHHLQHTVSSRRNAVMIVGYQAENTLGRRLADGEKRVRILGELERVRASVKVFDQFSAHADRDELLAFVRGMRRPPARTIIVHGSDEESLALARLLSAKGIERVHVPLDGERIDLSVA